MFAAKNSVGRQEKQYILLLLLAIVIRKIDKYPIEIASLRDSWPVCALAFRSVLKMTNCCSQRGPLTARRSKSSIM